MNKQPIHQTIREAAKAKGLAIRELSALCGVPYTPLRALCVGQHERLPLAQFFKVLDTLEIDTSTISLDSLRSQVI